MTGVVNVLHLSDLHFGMERTEKIPATALDQRELILSGLIETLGLLDKEWRPHFVAVSGDIGWKGREDDYQKGKDWLTQKLLPTLRLDPGQLIICPGNHDIDREETLGMKPPVSSDEADAWLKLERLKNFSRPFESFVDFCNKMGLPKLQIGDQSSRLTGKIDLHGLRFVVMNSAWFCRGDDDRNQLWLGKPMLEKMAANTQFIDEAGYDDEKSPITIALLHHPHEWLNESEYNTYSNRQNTLEFLSLRSHIILTGHVHARPAEPNRAFGPAWLVKGGASYAGNQYQNHFSILRVDSQNRSFQRLVYEFDPGKNCWRRDMEIKNYHLKKSLSPASPAPQLIIPGKYKVWIIFQCKDMDITKLAETSAVIQVRLPEIYIPLYANPLKGPAEKKEPVDIEDIIVESRFLIIEGRAGSGKTTLAKHFTYMLMQTPGWKGLDGYLPVLVFLKDLKGFDTDGLNANSETAEKLLNYWAEKTDSFLTIDIIRGFCEAGKAIFFLDGIDEIDEALRELVTVSFNAVKIKYENCKIILSGRPHGVNEVARKYFGQPVEILSLLMHQVEAFIQNWFKAIYASKEIGFNKTALDMIGEVKSHPSIHELIDSPLMLTAVCLLYNDNKQLPGQRSELYDRFVTNLLHKRFPQEAQKVRSFLMILALHMHKKRLRTIDLFEAIPFLADKYKSEEGEQQQEYKERLVEIFKTIEPNCGLLKAEKAGYAYVHLTFQEFLTANALVACTVESYFDTIRELWDDDWYREVVQLYIGYLSINNPAMANNIIQKILEEKVGKPFGRSLLAIRSIIDIHQEKRVDAVTQLSIKQLQEIIGSDVSPKINAEAGELLGRLGDGRDLEKFIYIPDGKYQTVTGPVTLRNFAMTKYPVTNRWYRKFLQDGGYKKSEFWSRKGQRWLEAEKADCPKYWFDYQWNCDNYPVVGVSWYEADAFCRWLTQKRQDGFIYRLPYEKEWEAAAAGKERRKYPWGEKCNNTECNTIETEIERTSAVGIFKTGNTPEGLSDMAGNVWEWTKTSEAPEAYAFRGGSWAIDEDEARCAAGFNVHPNERFPYVGFRCSRINV